MVEMLYEAAERFEAASGEHPLAVGLVTALVIYGLFGIVGAVEGGALPLPF